MLCYCKRCGRIVLCDQLEEECDYCQNVLCPVPDEYLGGKSKCYIINNLKQQFIDKYIKSSPELDQYLFEHREEDLAVRRMQNLEFLEQSRAIREGRSAQNRCFYCGSANIRKIGMFSRAVSAELWGLGSKKIGKQFHCNSCGADF